MLESMYNVEIHVDTFRVEDVFRKSLMTSIIKVERFFRVNLVYFLCWLLHVDDKVWMEVSEIELWDRANANIF